MDQYTLQVDDKQDNVWSRILRGTSDGKLTAQARQLEEINLNRHARMYELSERPNSFPLDLMSQNITLCSNRDRILRGNHDQKLIKGEEECSQRRRQVRFTKKKRRNCDGGRAPPPREQTGWGMRAIFLSGSGSRNGSPGTGVFLPSAIGNSFESGQKRGFSTVLIPARVVQALTLHFDKMGAPSTPNLCGQGGRHIINSVQQTHPEAAQQTTSHKELGLPQEWTY